MGGGSRSRKRDLARSQANRSYDEALPSSSAILETIYSVVGFLADIFKGSLFVLKPVLSVIMALAIFLALSGYGYRLFSNVFLETVCSLPVVGPHLPVCRSVLEPIPDFSHLVKVQESLYESMMSQTTPDTISALELKQVELATRDLQMMIKYSHLASADLLETKLTDYLVRSRRFGKDIQSLQAQTKGVLDNLITYNTFTLRKLSDVEQKKSSRQELRVVYESAMQLVEKEARRLILAIEKAQTSLNQLEEDLYAIQEISMQEQSYQRSGKPHILADLVNIIRGKGLQRPLVEENMQLLMRFDIERSMASQKLLMMLDRMEAFQMDLQELRTQVIAPIVVPDIIPLELHIENIGKSIERLKKGKVIAWEDRQQIEAPLGPD
ncbi:uncharacterized protein BYT42DRAFT_614538 [Radiomyces spectabilis]|uniref:uncharacterized protein n=1 Tax=Radiomyces spectabilis TaxID=64574 RepID=UPI00221EF92D|nr:uncharacterized protein BYT42DRAFT_614538 [Radiomyces spectabilis]KAI8377889.1 hypothetical protein BYT42DRAFT_614538 [Radiomyces spectabilis]